MSLAKSGAAATQHAQRHGADGNLRTLNSSTVDRALLVEADPHETDNRQFASEPRRCGAWLYFSPCRFSRALSGFRLMRRLFFRARLRSVPGKPEAARQDADLSLTRPNTVYARSLFTS